MLKCHGSRRVVEVGYPPRRFYLWSSQFLGSRFLHENLDSNLPERQYDKKGTVEQAAAGPGAAGRSTDSGGPHFVVTDDDSSLGTTGSPAALLRNYLWGLLMSTVGLGA